MSVPAGGWSPSCAVYTSTTLPDRWQWSASGPTGISMGGAATEDEAWEKARAAMRSLGTSFTPKGSVLMTTATEGYRPPTCATCSHPVGDHQSAGTGWPHPPRYGLCLHAGCDCEQFVDDSEQAAA